MLMAKLFIYNYNKSLHNFRFLAPPFFIWSVYFLFPFWGKAFQFQCYQKFIHSKPILLIKFIIPAKELEFIDINHKCIAQTEIHIQFTKHYKVFFEKRFSQSYILLDYQNPYETIFLDSIWIYDLEFGEYEVHFSLEQFHKIHYDKMHFHFENQWYRVNIHDVEIFDKDFFPIFDRIDISQDTLLLKFYFETEYSFPLTIRIQIFTTHEEQNNPYAVAYQSIYQQITTVNLKKGVHQKWIMLPFKEYPIRNYLIEINFFEEDNFVLSKQYEIQLLKEKSIIQKKLKELIYLYEKLGISIPIYGERNEEEFSKLEVYLNSLIEKSQKNPQKLQTLIHLGIPDKIIKQNREEQWIYYKYNRKVKFNFSV